MNEPSPVATRPYDIRALYTVSGSPHPRTVIVKVQACNVERAFMLAAHVWTKHLNGEQPEGCQLKALKL